MNGSEYRTLKRDGICNFCGHTIVKNADAVCVGDNYCNGSYTVKICSLCINDAIDRRSLYEREKMYE